MRVESYRYASGEDEPVDAAPLHRTALTLIFVFLLVFAYGVSNHYRQAGFTLGFFTGGLLTFLVALGAEVFAIRFEQRHSAMPRAWWKTRDAAVRRRIRAGCAVTVVAGCGAFALLAVRHLYFAAACLVVPITGAVFLVCGQFDAYRQRSRRQVDTKLE